MWTPRAIVMFMLGLTILVMAFGYVAAEILYPDKPPATDHESEAVTDFLKFVVGGLVGWAAGGTERERS